jgi:hypothetical protein
LVTVLPADSWHRYYRKYNMDELKLREVEV